MREKKSHKKRETPLFPLQKMKTKNILNYMEKAVYKILLADDDPFLRSTMKQVLSSEDPYIFYEAENGQEAIQIATHKMPDLIIMDWIMPEMDGIAAIKKIASYKETKQIPIILCSAREVDLKECKAFLEAGAVDFIQKPVKFAELFSRVRAMLNLSQSIKTIKEQKSDLEIYQNHLQELVDMKTRELKNANAKLTAYQSALNTSAAIVYTDRNGTITSVNDTFCKISQYKAEEIIGKNPRVMKSDVHPREFFEDLWKTILSGRVWKGEICNAAKDGSTYWLDTTIIPFVDEKGEPFQFLAIRFDNTVQKKAREGINQALIKEIELNKLKTAFISTASHEFKNPLATIQSCAEIIALLAKKQLDAETSGNFQKYIDRIIYGVEKINTLLNDILLLGRADSGRIQFNPIKTNLAPLIQKIMENDFSQYERVKDIDLEEEGDIRMISVDPVLFGHIISNLLSNALKYSQDKKAPEIKIEYQETEVKIHITDFGIGILKSEQEQIFSSFFRGSNTKKIVGTGLGLVIARQMVELHSGTISFESLPGEKTTFTVSFPSL